MRKRHDCIIIPAYYFYKILIKAVYYNFQKETSLPSIPTFCQNLDNLLGNEGVQLGSLTEVLGLPGTGKTQLW